MRIELKVLKATLMLRKLGNRYLTKEDQREELRRWYPENREEELDAWINDMREELSKTAEQREAESKEALEQMLKQEEEALFKELETSEHRDEWDDFWADRARDCGAVVYCGRW